MHIVYIVIGLVLWIRVGDNGGAVLLAGWLVWSLMRDMKKA